MYNRIIITSGVSLIFNNRYLIEQKQTDFFKLDEQLTDETTEISDELIDYLSKSLEKMDRDELQPKSAEISMVMVQQARKHLVDQPFIILFYTDTLKGRTAGFVNKYILEKVWSATVEMQKMFELDVDNRSLLNRALGKYLSDVSRALLSGEPKTTCFAPIGGYKVMTSLGYLVGALHNYPTAYLHEGSTVIHEIPAVNIEVDEDIIKKNHHIFKKFFDGDCFELDELSKEEQALIHEQSVMFDQVEGLVELNPFGRFLCDQDKYYKYFKSQVYFDVSLKRMIDNRYANYWGDVYEEIKQLIFQHEAKSARYRATLYHESAFSTLNGIDLQYHLYKGGNSPVIRAIWTYDKSDDSYYIVHIWFDHNDYDRESAQKIKRNDKQNKRWVNITEALYE